MQVAGNVSSSLLQETRRVVLGPHSYGSEVLGFCVQLPNCQLASRSALRRCFCIEEDGDLNRSPSLIYQDLVRPDTVQYTILT